MKETDLAECDPQVNGVNDVRSGRPSRDLQVVLSCSGLQEERPRSKDGCLGKDSKMLQTLSVRSGERDWGEEDYGDWEPHATSCRGFAAE